MDKKEREILIDKLLIYLNDDVESHGLNIKTVTFDFSKNDKDTQKIICSSKISFEDLIKIVKVCMSRGYLKYSSLGRGEYCGLRLTEEGQGRAISVDLAKNIPSNSSLNPSSIQIGTLNANSPSQVGNNNIQNIENAITFLIEQIDNSNVSDEEKQEVKSRLSAFLEHPVTASIIGAGTSALVNSLVGVS